MFYKHNIGILLATLIVALFIPNLGVVHADDDDEEDEDAYSDEKIPPWRSGFPNPGYADGGWRLEEVVQVAVMGEYDTSWGIPDWVTEEIEKYTRDRNDIAHKEPCRVVGNWQIYRKGKYEISKTETTLDSRRRGFLQLLKTRLHGRHLCLDTLLAAE
ncbi:MAG: hypothetical protein F4039_02395 [Gammaproteobacteria bacterium]|nr:hypothetical protein [Gammaproteobacteria bacterium]MYF53836.1 hypothetical protein [Gammaproteobacteria bacterium]MYK42924.1 hypothetical protein [Gammaproteobacteria bacterium]